MVHPYLLQQYFFAFQIYCDFSGYSDIAIGAARTMGFKLMMNFNAPFFSKNITEFWRRWHISLSTWFNDYLFTPVMFNKRAWGKYAVLYAVLLTFAVSGLWHGANWTYIIWGLLNGVALGYEFLTKKTRKKLSNLISQNIYIPVSIVLTFLYACFTWVFFRAPNLSVALNILYKILFIHGKLFIGDNKNMIYSVFFILLFITIETINEYKLFNGFTLFNNTNTYVRRLSYISIIILILMFGVFDNSQFIYFQF